MSWDVEIDVGELERDWAEACAVLSDGIVKGVTRGVTDAAAEARTTHAFKSHTGALEASIRGRIETATRGGAVGVIEALASYASYVEEGTSPHDIRPKAGEGSVGPLRQGQSRRKKGDVGTHRSALRFEVGGETRFAAVVHHPGGRSMPFMGPAVQHAERIIEAEVDLAVERAARIMER